MVTKLLQHLSHDVTACGDGSEALQLWQTGNYDVILMDVQMPVMDGIETTGVIRKQEKKHGGHTPIIALTAHALSEQRDQLLTSGFDGYVSKPIDIATLSDEMTRVIRH